MLRARSRDVRSLAAQLEKPHITWTLTHYELRWCERNKWYFRGKCVTSWCHLLHLAPSYISSHNKSLFSRSPYSYIHLWCHRFPLKTSPLLQDQRKKLTYLFLDLYKVCKCPSGFWTDLFVLCTDWNDKILLFPRFLHGGKMRISVAVNRHMQGCPQLHLI